MNGSSLTWSMATSCRQKVTARCVTWRCCLIGTANWVTSTQEWALKLGSPRTAIPAGTMQTMSCVVISRGFMIFCLTIGFFLSSLIRQWRSVILLLALCNDGGRCFLTKQSVWLLEFVARSTRLRGNY